MFLSFCQGFLFKILLRRRKEKEKTLIANYLNMYFRNFHLQLWMQKDLFMKQNNMQYAAVVHQS